MASNRSTPNIPRLERVKVPREKAENHYGHENSLNENMQLCYEAKIYIGFDSFECSETLVKKFGTSVMKIQNTIEGEIIAAMHQVYLNYILEAAAAWPGLYQLIPSTFSIASIYQPTIHTTIRRHNFIKNLYPSPWLPKSYKAEQYVAVKAKDTNLVRILKHRSDQPTVQSNSNCNVDAAIVRKALTISATRVHHRMFGQRKCSRLRKQSCHGNSL